MNEFSLLVGLLTRKTRGGIGIKMEKLVKFLPASGENELSTVKQLLQDLDLYLEPLGLQVRFNPLNNHWFISHSPEIVDVCQLDILSGKPRLSATLLGVLICSLKYSPIIPIHAIQEIRKKKTIANDLRDLAQLNLLTLSENHVSINPQLGHYLDLIGLFDRLHTDNNYEQGDTPEITESRSFTPSNYTKNFRESF